MTHRCRIILGAMTALGLCAAAAHGQAAWHAPGWSHRAVVKAEGGGSGGVDVAAVRVVHAGVARPDGGDYRLFSASGAPVPYEIAYHAPRRDTLLSFRAGKPDDVVYVYFGKGDAPADPMRAVAPAPPGSGPPTPGSAAGGWIPRAGLVLATRRRPRDADNPKTIQEMADLIAQSSALDGAGYRRNIRDGVNPFGDSDYFISVYRGWLRLAQAGTYGFCTASNEASFTFLDGKVLVHWPGRHTEQRGMYGQKSAEIEAAAGLHYVEYYHEEVLLYQVAFLGYRPPGGPHYVAIPDELFPQPHRAVVRRYETQDGRLTVMPRVDLLDSLWPRERPSGQYTRYGFVADAGADAADFGGWSFRWDFGDGQTATGPKAEHVYLAAGGVEVRLSGTGPGGARVERVWPLAVFPVEHLAEGFKAGRYADYRPAVTGYDRAKLWTDALGDLVCFLDEAGARAEAVQAAGELLGRGDASPGAKLDAHLVIAGTGGADTAWRSVPGPKAADHLQAALALAETPVAKVRVMARLIRHLGVDKADVEAAAKVHADAEALVKRSLLAGHLKRAFRDATIALGDAHLAADAFDAAGQDYRLAEALADPVMPQQVRVAKIGAYPERLLQLAGAGKLDEAADVVQEWYEQVPADILRGEVLFWMGKVEDLRGNARGAIRPLRMAIDVAEGAAFEAEGRWRLAEAYGRAGDAEARRVALVALVRSGLGGEWRDKAVATLKAMPSP